MWPSLYLLYALEAFTSQDDSSRASNDCPAVTKLEVSGINAVGAAWAPSSKRITGAKEKAIIVSNDIECCCMVIVIKPTVEAADDKSLDVGRVERFGDLKLIGVFYCTTCWESAFYIDLTNPFSRLCRSD